MFLGTKSPFPTAEVNNQDILQQWPFASERFTVLQAVYTVSIATHIQKKKSAQGKKYRKENGNLTEIRMDKRAKSVVQAQRPAELHGSSETIQQHLSMSNMLQRTLCTAYPAHHAALEATGRLPPSPASHAALTPAANTPQPYFY